MAQKGGPNSLCERHPLVARNLVLGWVFIVFFSFGVFLGFGASWRRFVRFPRPSSPLPFILLSFLLHPSLASFFHSVFPIRYGSLLLSPSPLLVLSPLDSFGVSHSLWFCSPFPPLRPSFHHLIHSAFLIHCGSVLPRPPLSHFLQFCIFRAELVRSSVGSPPAMGPTHLLFPRAISPCQGGRQSGTRGS